jgi:catalase
MHRQAINRGRVSYEPNSLAGGCPFQVGEQGFRSYAAVIPGPKARGRSLKFAEHYHQARLFWHSQTPIEQAHIVKAYRFELTKVQTVAIRRRMVAGLRNVDESLASRVAEGLGLELPPPLPLAWDDAPRPEIDTSAALSMFARPGDGALAGRRIALLVSHGVDAQAVVRLRDLLSAEGPAVHVVGATLEAVSAEGGGELEVDTTMEANPSVLYDAVAVGGSAVAIAALKGDGLAMEFLRDQFRHCKPMLLLGPARELLASMGVTPERAEATGVVLAEEGAVEHGARALCLALAQHRYFDRETDPPLV